MGEGLSEYGGVGSWERDSVPGRTASRQSARKARRRDPAQAERAARAGGSPGPGPVMLSARSLSLGRFEFPTGGRGF